MPPPLALKPAFHRLPLFTEAVPAGFPSPAEDYIEASLSLDELCVAHPAATFLLRAAGRSLSGIGIFDGDVLVVDRAVEPRPGHVVVAIVGGDFTCKVYALEAGRPLLLAANPDYAPIRPGEEEALEIFGVVTFCLHRLDPEVVRQCMP